MRLRHVLVATDESESARGALRAALALARRAGARVTVMTVIPAHASVAVSGLPGSADYGPAIARLEQWMDYEVRTSAPSLSVGLGVTCGVPGIEICRFADEREADLIVIGRKHRSAASRLLVGDTADAVVRRSAVPCLFVPPGASGAAERILVALDGSLRGLGVLQTTCDFARAVGAGLRAVTVEPGRSDEPDHLAAGVPSARSEALREAITRMDACGRSGVTVGDLLVRRGRPAPEILAAAQETGADTIATGFHRGGPSAVIEAGSTARQVTHGAECAVLTIPL